MPSDQTVVTRSASLGSGRSANRAELEKAQAGLGFEPFSL